MHPFTTAITMYEDIMMMSVTHDFSCLLLALIGVYRKHRHIKLILIPFFPREKESERERECNGPVTF